MANSRSWQKIFNDCGLRDHDFDKAPYILSAEKIKKCVQKFKKTNEKEVRILCKQDTREERPEVFKKLGLFILPTKNGEYAIIKGEGYLDIPEITTESQDYLSKLNFDLETSVYGDSEMQHLDFAYATGLVGDFTRDTSLVLTIRGRKYTPEFDFKVGEQPLHVKSVQTEVDAGYEGKNNVILVEAKNKGDKNVIIRQLYYPFRQWQVRTKKKVSVLFFEKTKENLYSIWEFEFADPLNYNSIKLVRSGRFIIKKNY